MASGTGIRKIIHVDMDAFYASVEQRDRPELRGKAIIVGGSPNSRGVVTTASYEARKYGVHSAMPCSQAARLCPHGIFVKPRFDAYKEASGIIREIFFEYTDLVEPLSLDEAYLDVTENSKGIPSATLIASEIKKRIKEETGLTASAGISYNKFLAKTASDIQKPDGLTLITPEEAEAFLEELDIAKFYGVGKATVKKFHAVGIKSGKDLRKWSEIELVKLFGKSGRYYYNIIRGHDPRPVKPNHIRKSYGKERTFSSDIEDPVEIYRFLEELSGRVAEGMKKNQVSGKTITLKIRYDDFETITRSTSLPYYTNEESEIINISRRLLENTEIGYRKVRLVGISLSNLDQNRQESAQLSFKF